jgi:hypothetical protein
MRNGMVESYEPPLVSKLVNNNTILTNTNESLDPLEINITKLSNFGITKKHINDLKNQKLQFTTFTLQDFVNRFAEYASNPSNISNIGSIPGLFCKMAQLASKGEDPLVGIETEEDRAINKRMELLKRKKEDREKREAELFNLEFGEWYSAMDTTQMLKLIPEAGIVKGETRVHIAKQYYLDNVWANRENQ